MQAHSAVWQATYAQSITLAESISDDWDPRFDSPVATNRVSFQVPGPGGSLNYSWIGATGYHRFKMTFDSDAPRVVPATLSGSRQDDAAGGYIQIKLNGTLYEYLLDSPGGGVAHHNLSLSLKEGRNEIVICKQYTPYAVVFQANLIGSTTGTPVDTSLLPRFRY